jgi:hypothetical protein
MSKTDRMERKEGSSVPDGHSGSNTGAGTLSRRHTSVSGSNAGWAAALQNQTQFIQAKVRIHFCLSFVEGGRRRRRPVLGREGLRTHRRPAAKSLTWDPNSKMSDIEPAGGPLQTPRGPKFFGLSWHCSAPPEATPGTEFSNLNFNSQFLKTQEAVRGPSRIS